jgi:type IV pilus assembly protein PilC
LAESLKVIAGQLETTHNLEKKVKGSMMYPSVILCVMILVGVLMMIFVVPTLLKTFTEMNVELPFTTKMILFASDAIRYNGPIMAAVLVLVAGSLFYASKTKTGKSLIQKSYLKIPIIGGLVQEVNTARTARTLSSLLTSGVGVVESVNIASTVVQNVHFKKVLESAAESIKKGDLMSKTFGEHVELYPVFFVEMLSVGEETGKIGEMLMGVAHYFEEDVDRKTKDMSTIIEPFLIVLIGAAVGFFAVAMIMPMYSLVDVIN